MTQAPTVYMSATYDTIYYSKIMWFSKLLNRTILRGQPKIARVLSQAGHRDEAAVEAHEPICSMIIIRAGLLGALS